MRNTIPHVSERVYIVIEYVLDQDKQEQDGTKSYYHESMITKLSTMRALYLGGLHSFTI